MTAPGRRAFLARLARAAAGTALAPLATAMTRTARADCPRNGSAAGFGPLSPRLPRNAAALRNTVVGDLSREPLLALPDGFGYTAVSLTAERMDDGVRVPGKHDGMACFARAGGGLRVVRNHELLPAENVFGNRAGALPPNGRVYDAFHMPPGLGAGGTTTLTLDGEGNLLGHHVSLGGTLRNCSGGPTPWGTWLSCEEIVVTPADAAVLRQRHGYVFEVAADADEAVDPQPVVGAGRFNHEAAAWDSGRGVLYLTEDADDGALYRFVPATPPTRAGDLAGGGRLEALRVVAVDARGCDGGSLPRTPAGGVDTRRRVHGFLGQPLAVDWVPVTEPDPDHDTVRLEAAAAGAALFARGEGAWFSGGLLWFVCTTGGDAGCGQVWSLDPAEGTLVLRIESPGADLLDQPDNITVAADGALYLMEDGAGGNRVQGVTPRGDVFPFLAGTLRRPDRGGRLDTSEFCGGCFSPDGRLFLVNTQGIGITFAVSRDDGAPILLPA